MNPNLLKQLAMVVKQGSISAAAEQLFITQPTLTRALQQLEMRVGAPVLKRTRYGMVPTEVGARLAQIGERILAEAEQGDELIRQWHSGYQNEFTLGIDPLWEFATVESMTAFLLSESRYVFHLRTGSAALQIELLQRGALDFLLAPAHLSVAQGSLQRKVLFRDRSGVFAGRRSALVAARTPVSPQQLEAHHWIKAGASAGFLGQQDDPSRGRAARMATTGSILTILHLLDESDFLVQLPARLALMTDRIQTQQRLRIDGWQPQRRDIALWWRTESEERPDFLKVRALLENRVNELDAHVPEFGLDI